LAGSEVISAQYGGTPAGVQLFSLPAQLAAQLPIEQTCPEPQAVPQVPQLRLSVCRSTHRFWHSFSPVTQLTAQTPTPLQTSPDGQITPQPPQLTESFCTSAQ
jgi:hypothetical protein